MFTTLGKAGFKCKDKSFYLPLREVIRIRVKSFKGFERGKGTEFVFWGILLQVVVIFASLSKPYS